MKVTETALPGVILIEPRFFEDDRGYFYESYQVERYREFGIDVTFVQDNVSRSRQGVLRGMHYQIQQPQAKLAQVLEGEVFDVAVDLRRNSPQFGRWVGFRLSAENKQQLYVPIGLAHGFYVTSPHAVFHYKCSDFYAPEVERGLRWDDPDVAIVWPEGERLIAPRDAAFPLLRDINGDVPE